MFRLQVWRNWKMIVLGISLCCCQPGWAQAARRSVKDEVGVETGAATGPTTSRPAGQPVQEGAENQQSDKAASEEPSKKEPSKKVVHFKSKAFGTSSDGERPRYVKSLDKAGLKDMDWLDFGLEHRARYELRDDDYRRPEFQTDEPFHLRSRGYLGVKKILDPFRFVLEFSDGRLLNSKYPDNPSDADENEIYQLHGRLYFKDMLGPGQPISLDFGRMVLEYVGRRLVHRSGWRNATHSFDGFRLRLGEETSDWQFDFFAVQPVERLVRKPDRGDEERWFYGLVGSWRKWSKIITLEPYYFILSEQRKNRAVNDRELHTLGFRGFGPIGDTGFDYDFDNAYQFGKDGDLIHRAFGCAGELGYTFKHKWTPRISSVTSYASGDRNPNDRYNNRFDNMFGSNHSLVSMTDLFTWRNLILTKLRLEMTPLKNVRFDTAYGGYWLASDSDAWVIPGRRDRSGRSGDCIGSEWDARIRYKFDPRAELEVAYSHFFPGNFVKNTGPAKGSDFFYVAMTLQFP